MVPQYLRWWQQQPLQEVDRVAHVEGGRYVIMEPIPVLQLDASDGVGAPEQ